MSALKPLESHDVWPIEEPYEERKLLRRAVLGQVCAHPGCDNTNVTAHHLFPRSFIKDSSWFVRVPGAENPILHVVGLCGDGTTGHHGDLEEHRGWVKYEDGVWNWYCRETMVVAESEVPPYQSDEREAWILVGPLDPQPGARNAGKPRKSKKRKGETRPYRAQWNVGVPKDERENGADVLDELEAAVREKYQAEMGWSESVPRYHVIVACLVKALQ